MEGGQGGDGAWVVVLAFLVAFAREEMGGRSCERLPKHLTGLEDARGRTGLAVALRGVFFVDRPPLAPPSHLLKTLSP